MIKNHEIRFFCLFDSTNLIELASTHKKLGGGRTPMPRYHRYRLAARRSDQFLELLGIERLPAIIDSELNQNDIFTAGMTVKELGV